MMNKYEQAILKYARGLLSNEQYNAAIDYPLYGNNGVRKLLGEISIEAFAKLYFNDMFYLNIPPFHNDIINDIIKIRRNMVLKKPGLKIARAVPRTHSKSTWYSFILPLHG